METRDLKELLLFIANAKKNNDFGSDVEKIEYLYTELEKIQTKLPTIDELEKLRKIEIYLETAYDDFNDLSYYFSPYFIKIRNKIHQEYVKKIRRENKEKRGKN